LHEADAILFGRKTYEGMAGYWPTAEGEGEIADFMNSVPKIVFSRTLKQVAWNNSRLAEASPEEEVTTLKRQPGKSLFLFGSANLASTLTQHDLIDEYRVCVAPLLLGEGTPLFKPSAQRLNLDLIEARPLNTGGVILRYRPRRG
jgi:dihydrofolate reductase